MVTRPPAPRTHVDRPWVRRGLPLAVGVGLLPGVATHALAALPGRDVCRPYDSAVFGACAHTHGNGDVQVAIEGAAARRFAACLRTFAGRYVGCRTIQVRASRDPRSGVRYWRGSIRIRGLPSGDYRVRLRQDGRTLPAPFRATVRRAGDPGMSRTVTLTSFGGLAPAVTARQVRTAWGREHAALRRQGRFWWIYLVPNGHAVVGFTADGTRVASIATDSPWFVTWRGDRLPAAFDDMNLTGFIRTEPPDPPAEDELPWPCHTAYGKGAGGTALEYFAVSGVAYSMRLLARREPGYLSRSPRVRSAYACGGDGTAAVDYEASNRAVNIIRNR